MTRKTKSISLALISSSLILAGCADSSSSSSGHHGSHVGGRAFIPIPIPIPMGGAGGAAPRGTASPGVSNLSSPSSHIGSGVSSSSHSGGFGSSGHSSGS